MTPIWAALPAGARYGTILDLGCGYGRIALHLGIGRGIACDRHVGVDIADGMLRHLLRYREQFDLFPAWRARTRRAAALLPKHVGPCRFRSHAA